MTKKILKLSLFLLIIVGVGGYFFVENKNPVRDGKLNLKNLTSAVTVKFDNYGVPHIFAKNDSDLYRALGYVHAQDRLFQMELLRRLSQGKLSEILGEKLIGVDRLFLTLGLDDYADKWLQNASNNSNPKLLSAMDDYLDGVNQYVENGPKPLEFNILGIPEHRYSRKDIITIMGYMSFSFAQALRDDPLVTRLAQEFPPQYLADLDLLNSDGHYKLPVDKIELNQISLHISKLVDQIAPMGLFHGSNSWVLSGSKTVSGKPILVNDPHIALSQPSVWYEADLHSNHTKVYGHFLALIPFPLLGFNENMAWGLTMFENDDMDLYQEKVNPQNPKQYLAVDHWQDFSIRKRTIKVKNHDDVTFEVWKSRHGPIVNNMFSTMLGKKDYLKHFNKPIAMWWKFLESGNKQVEAFYELPFADTLEKASRAAEKIHAPGLNLMYANAHGDIAWWATAQLPIRPQHVNPKMILDGASGKDDIMGYYDFSHNPHLINPSKGYLYTANNQPRDMGDGLIPGYYAPEDRPRRITKFLNSKEKFTAEDMKTLLMDNTTPMAQQFVHIFSPLLKNHKDKLTQIAQKALDIFSSWKGNHDPDQIGASIYTEFRLAFLKLAFEDEIGKDLYIEFQHGFLLDRSLWKLIDKVDSPWWDNIHTAKKETRDELALAGFIQAVENLQNRFGKDMNNWQWKNEVQLIHPHILGRVKPLDKIFNVGPFPSRSGIEAVNNLKFKSDKGNLTIMMGPSTRRIIDFSNIDRTWGILPSGQSGVVSDKHYDDQAEDYANGKFRHQWIREKDIDQHRNGTLMLLPAK